MGKGKLKQLAKDCLPPLVTRLLRAQLGKNKAIDFSGDYASWEDAMAASSGYDGPGILNKVKEATLKVKNGEAAFERDAVVFDHIEYSWPLLAALLWAAARNEGKLNVLDFGGSLGSSYFQNRKFLSSLPDVKWNVVEQEQFVQCGRDYIQDKQLRFYLNADECTRENKANILLLCSVLSYVPNWRQVLEALLKLKIPLVLIDRTPFILNAKERIAIQRVPEWIYPASYPCRFLEESQLLDVFTKAGYELHEEFPALGDANIASAHKGFIFKLANK